MRCLTALSLLIALAPADAVRADGAAGPVMEVVTFRLAPGTTEAAFLTAARATEAPLSRQPGFVSRRLLQGDGGLWTDLVEWQTRAQAEAAAAVMMADPAFTAFIVAIDPASIAMSHPGIRWRMGD